METTPLTLAALIGVLTLLVVVIGMVISGMRLYAAVRERLANLESIVNRLERIHNGHQGKEL